MQPGGRAPFLVPIQETYIESREDLPLVFASARESDREINLTLAQTRGVVSLRLFDPHECREIVKRLEQLGNWTEALIREPAKEKDYNDVISPAARSASLPSSEQVAWIYSEFERRIDLQIKPVVKKLWQLDLNRQSDTQLLKYEIGGHYRPHRDTGADLEKRLFSVVCYLNDDFEGGRTLFPPLQYAVTPAAGLAILFPSTYLHGSEPVTQGRKFVLVSWLDGPVPIKWI